MDTILRTGLLLMKYTGRKTLVSLDIQAAIRILYLDYQANALVRAGTTHIVNYNNEPPRISEEEMARINLFRKEVRARLPVSGKRLGFGAPIYFLAVLDELARLGDPEPTRFVLGQSSRPELHIRRRLASVATYAARHAKRKTVMRGDVIFAASILCPELVVNDASWGASENDRAALAKTDEILRNEDVRVGPDTPLYLVAISAEIAGVAR